MSVTTDSASPAEQTETPVASEVSDPPVDQSPGSNDDSPASDKGAATAEAKSGIDIIRDVLKADADADKEEPPPSPSDSKDTKPTASDSETPPDAERDVVAEAEKNPKWRDHPVFKKLTGELKATRGELAARDARIAELTPAAQAAQDFAGFLSASGLQAQHATELITLAALIRTDPAKAREGFASIVADLDAALGEVLPSELQKKVDDGDLEREDALRISRAEAKANREAAHRRNKETEVEAKNTEAQRAQSAAAVRNAVNARANAIKSRDPDFEKKEPMLEREVTYLISKRGAPKSAEDAVKLFEEAYGNVNNLLSETMPKPKAITPNPSNGNKKPSDATSINDPKLSTLEVTRRAMGL